MPVPLAPITLEQTKRGRKRLRCAFNMRRDITLQASKLFIATAGEQASLELCNVGDRRIDVLRLSSSYLFP